MGFHWPYVRSFSAPFKTEEQTSKREDLAVEGEIRLDDFNGSESRLGFSQIPLTTAEFTCAIHSDSDSTGLSVGWTPRCFWTKFVY